ncbi:hypothetical protein [Flavisphingomonas formosensis]|uniref:hypothetical protein n=1 Tax=Flavisphingomonas formosensis TaxID=861534 RepID=UPI0012F9EE90|nr:hypothetical protein [Sphingomonas formosensis]
MVWDLRGALLRKEEKESARLADFEFRLRARAMRLLAERLGPPAEAASLVAAIARRDDAGILEEIGQDGRIDSSALQQAYEMCRAEARQQLTAELGDPSPHRLA